MQVILTASDFATMPTALRQELLAYLATRRKSAAPSTGRRRRASESEMFDGLAEPDRDRAFALVRLVSFGRALKGLHDLLEALSYEKGGDAPGSERLTRLLKLDDARRRDDGPGGRLDCPVASRGRPDQHARLERHRDPARSHSAAGAPRAAALGLGAPHRLFSRPRHGGRRPG